MAVSPRSERRTTWHSHIASEHGTELRAIMPLLLLGVPGTALGRAVGGGSVDPAGGGSYPQLMSAKFVGAVFRCREKRTAA